MTITTRLLACISLSLCLGVWVSAQPTAGQEPPAKSGAAPASTSQVAPAVAVAASGARVRFTAVGTVARMRVEVFDALGGPVFDSGLLPGSVRDWDVRGAQGQTLADGQYLCVVTVRDLSGRMSVKQGTVLLRAGEASLLALGESEQAGDVAAGGGADVLAPVDNTAPPAVTVTAHDGRDGQVTSTTGALTFRTGDMFSGADKEQMRVTPDGRIGVGTSDPQATLDVAGAVRASAGFQFSDGSRLSISDSGALVRTSTDGSPLPGPSAASVAAATTNRLAKFLDPSGTLGDSAVTETNGNVGIGVAVPGDSLDIAGPPNAAGRTGIRVRTTTTTGNSTLYFDNDRGNFAAYGGLLTGGSANAQNFFGGTRADKTFLIADGASSLGLGIGTLPARPLFFGTANVERMRITPAGNVGIGNPNPASKLHVEGNINTSTQYDLEGTRALSVAGKGNLYVGTNAGANSCDCNDQNTFVGDSAGSAYTGTDGGFNNSFFGYHAGGNGSGAQLHGVTLIGTDTVSANGLSNATAIGYKAKVTQSNSLVLGGISGENSAADTNVGIGTTAPSARLHVRDNNGNILFGNAGCASGFAGIGFGASLSGCTNYSLLGDGTDTIINRPAGGTLDFREGNTTQMLITTGGNVGIGTENHPSFKLEVNGEVAGVGDYQNISDVRFKKNIQPLTGALGKVLRLRGVSFDWRRDEFPALNFNEGRQVGFIAQELAGVLPEAVTTDNRGFYRMASAEVTPVLVEAVKEQQQMIDSQQQTIAELRRQNASLRARHARQEVRLGALESAVASLAQSQTARQSHGPVRRTRRRGSSRR